MGHVESTRTIHAPPEAVWNCLNDIEHTPQWVTGLVSAEVKTPEPYGTGTIYHDHNRLGPFLQVTPWHITVFEPLRRQVHVAESASLPTTMTLNLAPVPDGTQLQMIVDYQFLPRLKGIGRLLENLLMNRLLTQVLKQNMAGLDRYLNRRDNY